MKANIRKIFIFSLFVLASASLFAEVSEPMKGCSHTEFGDYTISLSKEPLMFNKKELTTYDLKYKNIDQVIKVAIDEKRKCRNFIVKYTNFEVQYVCDKRGFGVQRVSPEFKSVDADVVSVLMDETQFNYQEIILNENEKTDQELLHLIACFFPKLIDEQYRKLAKA